MTSSWLLGALMHPAVQQACAASLQVSYRCDAVQHKSQGDRAQALCKTNGGADLVTHLVMLILSQPPTLSPHSLKLFNAAQHLSSLLSQVYHLSLLPHYLG